MPTGHEHGAPWDESAALEELERLKRGIEEWRRRRKDVQADFDRFVRGFRTPPPERDIGRPTNDTPAVQVAARTADLAPEAPTIDTAVAGPPITAPPVPPMSAAIPSVTAAEPAVSMSEPSAVLAESHVPAAFAMPVTSRALSPAQRKRRTQVIVAAGVVALVIAVAALLTLTRDDMPDGSSARGPQPAAARTTQAPRPTAPSDSRPDPVVAERSRSEITALRRVWLRVVVDGTREVERELQAGDRIPLRAGRTVVIRAGNAGALRLTINGEDRGTLGPEGEVVTRTLQIPPAPDR
jgi:hypothetical protein